MWGHRVSPPPPQSDQPTVSPSPHPPPPIHFLVLHFYTLWNPNASISSNHAPPSKKPKRTKSPSKRPPITPHRVFVSWSIWSPKGMMMMMMMRVGGLLLKGPFWLGFCLWALWVGLALLAMFIGISSMPCWLSFRALLKVITNYISISLPSLPFVKLPHFTLFAFSFKTHINRLWSSWICFVCSCVCWTRSKLFMLFAQYTCFIQLFFGYKYNQLSHKKNTSTNYLSKLRGYPLLWAIYMWFLLTLCRLRKVIQPFILIAWKLGKASVFLHKLKPLPN